MEGKKRFQAEFITAWEDLEKDSRQIFLGWEHVWGHHALTEVFWWWCWTVIGYGNLQAIPGNSWLIPLSGDRFLLFLHYASICKMRMHVKALTFRHPWIWSCLLGSVLQQLPGIAGGSVGGPARLRHEGMRGVGILTAEPGVTVEARRCSSRYTPKGFAGWEGLNRLPCLGSGHMPRD